MAPEPGKASGEESKNHLLDSGLAGALMDLDASQWNDRRNEFGKLMESFVIQQLIAQSECMDERLRFWHYRDRDQVEVDCVVTRGDSVWGGKLSPLNL